ncbi:hypothetical protein N7523_004055 [Penicillium sp. IBT 18751x]|nr:hypothetical protein N7523_004055 [Penicillium sp. IBT 18751x]
MKRFLAIDIVRLAGDEAYIDKILSRFTFASIKPIHTPFNKKEAIKRVYRYLKGSKSLCLYFSYHPAVSLALFAYVDAL